MQTKRPNEFSSNLNETKSSNYIRVINVSHFQNYVSITRFSHDTNNNERRNIPWQTIVFYFSKESFLTDKSILVLWRNISWHTKVFWFFATVSWYFTALAKVGDTTFTITAAKTVCNRVKNKSQIQRRDEILRKCKIIV